MTSSCFVRRFIPLGLLAVAFLVVLIDPARGERPATTKPDSIGKASSAKPSSPRIGQGKGSSKAAATVTKRTARVAAQDEETKPADENPFTRRIKAPSLDGGVEWINTAGPIDLKQLRGKFVLLDFWTYCCINCMHILPELKKLEHAYPNEIVVIGVHSAKFENEQDSKNIREAVERYEIEHPVVNDAKHVIWDKFEVQSWPTLCVIDPEGNIVAVNGGEVEFEMLDAFFKRVLPYYKAKGLLKPSPPLLTGKDAGYVEEATPLRYPGKVLADEKTDRLYIADSNHNRIVVTKLDGSLVDVIGSGQIGAVDGDFASSTFDHPQGMALDKDALYVADTENHLLRKVDLRKRLVSTIAGTGKQGRGWPGVDEVKGTRKPGKTKFVGPALKTAINSPWALVLHGRDLFIAMAGPHQIWKLSLGRAEIGPFAGNGREDIVDGPLLPGTPYETGFASFAQPSGLTSDGKLMYVADSEGSSIRSLPFDPLGNVETILGTAWAPAGRLFLFGDVDGQGQRVRLQHALDVLFHDGQLYVADTYNNKIKVVDPLQATSKTLAGNGKPGSQDDPAEFDEPAGLAYAKRILYVADTNNHLIRTIDLNHGNKVGTFVIKELTAPERPKTEVKPNFPNAEQVTVAAATLKPADGKVTLKIDLKLPPDFKINPLAPLRYIIEADSKGPVQEGVLGKLTSVTPPAAGFDIVLPVDGASGTETLKVSLGYFYCQEGSEGVCKAGSVVWNLPLTLSDAATESSASLLLEVKE